MRDQRTIGPHLGPETAILRHQLFTGAQHPTLNHLAKWHTRLSPAGRCDLKGRFVKPAHPIQPRGGNGAIRLFALNPNKITTQHFGHGPRGAGAKKRV